MSCRAYDRDVYARLLDAAPEDSEDAVKDTTLGEDTAIDVALDVRDAGDVGDVPVTSDAFDARVCDPIRVPSRPPGLTDADGGTVDGGSRVFVFGLRRVILGFASRALWGQRGFDRDGFCTDPTLPDAGGIPCRPRRGTPPVEDGERGRDNALGSRLGLTFEAAGWNESGINNAITNGVATIALRITGLGGPDDGEVLVEWLPVMNGHHRGDPRRLPQFDGMDVWHINSTLAYDPGAPSLARVRAERAFVTGGVLVAPFPSRSPLWITSSRRSIRLTLSGSRLVGRIQSDGSALGPLEFSAWWPLSDARADMATVGFCPPPPPERETTWRFVNDTLEAAADLLSTEEIAPTVECDSISVGFGTEWVPIQLGNDEAGPMVDDNPCAIDAGSDASPQG